MVHRIEIISKVPDTRASVRKNKFQQLAAGKKVQDVFVVDVYTIDKDFSAEDLQKIAQALSNPVTQTFSIDAPCSVPPFVWAIEIGFLPGVTDNLGNTAREIIEDLLRVKFNQPETVYSSQLTYIQGPVADAEARAISDTMANTLIQRLQVKSAEEYIKAGGMEVIVPRVKLAHQPQVSIVALDLTDDELKKLGKAGVPNEDGTRRGPLALDLESLHIIQRYFKAKGRQPTDIEIEALAQTWSEHCKHTIFAAALDDIADGIFDHYIKRATAEIRRQKGSADFCVSVFKDNSGGIVFDENWIVTDKVETHNSPSALDPFGGAITGIVGVNRDTIGFGLGAKPIINRYGFCFADPTDTEPLYKDEKQTQAMISPKRIMEGVIAGVNVGGNCSGIPTTQGFMYFDKRYKGKPLVFVGTVGLIPQKLGQHQSWEKQALPGDKIVVIGGRVGQDGIHGATFSSEALGSGSPSTAVQIGDPITQKKFSDAVVKEARQLNLYSSITDNGAGGISCSVAEMAKESNGCLVDLEKNPLKYPGLDPWQIWISESQERMTLSIPPAKLAAFMDLMQRRGVEATVIGEFNDSGKCVVNYNGQTIMDIELDFLHNGLPKKTLHSKLFRPIHEEPQPPLPVDLAKILPAMLSRNNTGSFDFVSHQFDHVVQASTIIGPLQGLGRVNGQASVVAPIPTSQKGVVVSQGLNPKYSDIDTYHMAACAIDTAVRNTLAVGGSLDKLALLDNFCWCSSEEPERLYQLKEAARACYETAVQYGTPFISGKDSMYNDFNGYDTKGKKVKISVPPTLLVSTIGIIDDYSKCVTLDAKFSGDLVYVIGETAAELGGSEYYDYLGGLVGNTVPQVNVVRAIKLYRALMSAMEAGIIASCESISLGGLGVSLARIAVAGQLGLDVSLAQLPVASTNMRSDYILFSESQSRFVVTVNPKQQGQFENIFHGLPFGLIGTVCGDGKFTLTDAHNKNLINTDIAALDQAYRLPFKGY